MKPLLLVLFLLLSSVAYSPILDDKDLKITSYNKKNQHEKAPKKIYIRSFMALFEVFEEAAASTSGSKNDRANRTTVISGTSTRMGVQIQGVDVIDFQKMIDEAYAEFVQQVTSQGYEIMSADEAGKSELLAGYTRMKGGASSNDQAKGFVMVTPTGYDYWVKGVSNSGKEKGTLTDQGPKISKALGDAYVADVNFIFPFVDLDASSSNWTNSSSVKANIAFRIESMLNTSQSNQQTSLTSFAKGFASIGTAELLYSKVRIVSGSDIGNPFFDANIELKKAVYFDGVFKDNKIKEVTSAEVATFSKTGYSQLVLVSGGESNVASHFAAADHDAYVTAASSTMSEMIQKGIGNLVYMNNQ